MVRKLTKINYLILERINRLIGLFGKITYTFIIFEVKL